MIRSQWYKLGFWDGYRGKPPKPPALSAHSAQDYAEGYAVGREDAERDKVKP